jgi:tetratricopeptide (TPR) repeat protein
MASTYFNEGVDYFNNGEYSESITAFENYLERESNGINPYKLDAYFYAGVSHFVLGQYGQALENYEVCVKNDYKNPLLYNDLANIYLDKGQVDQASSYLETGIELDPENKELLITELNILNANNDYNTAEDKIGSYLLLYPTDFEALLMAGTIYEKNRDKNPGEKDMYYKKIREVYTRAVALKPNDFHANYNLGVTLYNRGVDVITSKTYDTELTDLQNVLQESSKLFQEALPYLEKSRVSRQNDLPLLKALRGIYYNLNMSEKLEEVSSTIEGME